jgi:hypothetical protein
MAFGNLRGTLQVAANSITNPTNATGSVAVSIGDLVYVVVGEQTSLTATAVTSSLVTTYTATNAGTDSGTVTGRAFWGIVTTAGTLTSVAVAATGSTDNVSIVVAVFEGPFDLSPLDANPANLEDIASPFTGPATGTLARANELIVSWAVNGAAGAWTATAPNTIRVELATQAVLTSKIGSQVVTATTTVSPEWTGTNPTDSVLGTTSFMGTAVATTRPDYVPEQNRKSNEQRQRPAKTRWLNEIAAPIFIPTVAGIIAASSPCDALVLERISVYDPVAGPVFVEPVAAAAPTLVDLGSDTVRRPQRRLPTDAVASAFAPLATPIVVQPVDDGRRIKTKLVTPAGADVFAPPTIVPTPTAFGYQIVDGYSKPIRKKISEGFSAALTPPAVAVATPSAFGYQTVEAYAKPIRKRQLESFAAPLSPPAVAAINSTIAFAFGEATVIWSKSVYDPVAAPVFVPAAAVATPAAIGYQPSDLFPRKVPRRVLPISSFVVAIPVDDFGWQVHDHSFKPKRKVISDQLTAPPQAFVVAATPSAFVYQTVEPFAKPIRKRLSESFALAPQAFIAVATPSAFGYQTVEPFAKPIRKRLSEPFALAPQAFVAVATPSVFGYQFVYGQAKPKRRSLPDGEAAPQRAPVVATFGFEFVYGQVKPKIRPLPYGIADVPRAVVATPSAFGYQTVDGFRKPVRKILPAGEAGSLFPPAPPVATPAILFDVAAQPNVPARFFPQTWNELAFVVVPTAGVTPPVRRRSTLGLGTPDQSHRSNESTSRRNNDQLAQRDNSWPFKKS